ARASRSTGSPLRTERGAARTPCVTWNRAGRVLTSRSTHRTATFLFYIGDRYFGAITAYVQGREAENYHFTSALPVTILKLLAPTIVKNLETGAQPATSEKIEEVPTPHKINFLPSGPAR